MKTLCPQEDVYLDVHSSFTIIAQNWNKPRFLSLDEWIKKLPCSYNGISLSNNEGKTTNTCSDRNKSRKHPELPQGVHNPYFSLGEVLGQAKLIYGGGLGAGKDWQRSMKEFSVGIIMFSTLAWLWVIQADALVKMYLMETTNEYQIGMTHMPKYLGRSGLKLTTYSEMYRIRLRDG